MTCVIDASALLAYFLREPGADRVRAALRGRPTVATLNLAEVVHRLTLAGWPRGGTVSVLGDLPVTIVDVDRELALDSGFAVAVTKPWGLSIADRVCLLLAKRLDVPALTGDRNWLEVADLLGVRVELIR